MSNVFEKEMHFIASNNVDITYLEDPFKVANYDGKKKLMFIFQSLGDEKSDRDELKFPWTMVNGFRYLNCRKIYIKDNYGLVGCYYLGINGKFDVESAVCEFIRSKVLEYEISKKNIMFYGNSKGGYAALNFAFKFGGNVCCAVPQFDLYSWITRYKPHMAYIFPKEMSETVVEKYTNYLKRTIENYVGSTPKVTIITSHNDNTYEEHIPALLESLKGSGINPEVWYNDELYITRHNNVVINSLNTVYYVILRWLMELPE